MTLYLLHSWAAFQAHTFIHSHTAQYFHPTPWTWETQFHPKRVVIRVSFWELIRLSFCLLRQTWIWTWVLTNLMSGDPGLVPEPLWVSLRDQNSLPKFAVTESPSPWINTSVGSWHKWPSWCVRETELVRKGENTTLWIPHVVDNSER
jgi:hypothetical protein